MAKGDEEKPKKRVSLEVLQDRPKTLLEQAELGNADAEGRSPGAWVLLGTFAVFTILVPLAMTVMMLLRNFGGPIGFRTLLVASITCLCISCFGGGYLVGRFGGPSRPKHAAWTGALAGLVMWGLTIATGASNLGGRSLYGAVVLLLTVPAAWLGGVRGRRSRKPGD